MRRNDKLQARRAVTAVLATALLATAPGCGSSSGGGIDGSGVVFGPIEALGSIVVSGISFDVDNADVVLDARDRRRGYRRQRRRVIRWYV